MGGLRAPYPKAEWGDAIHGDMRRIKDILDPEDLLNPVVMFTDSSLVDNLKSV
jgi:FAD/FMN-containing dehydrogenase